MHPLVELVRASLTTTKVLGERLLAGVSGGADSVALLLALHELAPQQVIAAHLDHRLRGAESDADAAWVDALAVRLGVPLVSERIDVRERAARERIGVEEAARGARYEFFIRAAGQVHARFVAVAHTADDQAETVLHHVLRGTGLKGLAGIPQMRELSPTVVLIRPLLRARRGMVEDYLKSKGQDHRQDASNADRDYTRNRIRHELLPLLSRDYNPQVVGRLTALADLARDAQGAIAQQAAALVHDRVEFTSLGEVLVPLAELQAVSRHVVRELFIEIWKRQNWPRQNMDQRHWDALANLVLDGGTATHLPGRIEARSRRDTLTLRRAKDA